MQLKLRMIVLDLTPELHDLCQGLMQLRRHIDIRRRQLSQRAL
jgi:hypothetical protein